MAEDKPTTNRKAADRLAEIRGQIAVLRTEEEALRQGFISGDLDPVGDEYDVTVKTKVNERIDGRSMRQKIDEAIWRPFLIENETVCVPKTLSELMT
jgi:hypothetical protein